MNRYLIPIICVVVLCNEYRTVSSMDRAMIPEQLVSQNAIPVLFFNDYIVPVGSSYQGLRKEAYFLEKSFLSLLEKRKYGELFRIKKNDGIVKPYDYRDSEMVWEVDSCFGPEDFKCIEEKLADCRVCMCSILSGMTMLGAILVLIFCKQ
jgi:hypothetical protein